MSYEYIYTISYLNDPPSQQNAKVSYPLRHDILNQHLYSKVNHILDMLRVMQLNAMLSFVFDLWPKKYHVHSHLMVYSLAYTTYLISAIFSIAR